MKPKKKKVFIRLSAEEWEIVNNRIRENGTNNLCAYLRKEILKAKSKLEDCPDCILTVYGTDKKIEKHIPVEDYAYETIKLISLKTKWSMSTVVQELFITPLLLKDMAADFPLIS